MTEHRDATVPLRDDWSARDSHDTFFEYIALCREEFRAGKKLPPMFRPREQRDKP